MAKRLDALSIADAQAIALAAQGFDKPRAKTKATQQQVEATVNTLGVIQIDSVNVLVRSQELPLFSRLGNHDRNAIPKATDAKKLFEYWGHAAAHLPTGMHPLFRWKMDDARKGRVKHWGLTSFYNDNKIFVKKMLKHVADQGPTTARELSTRTEKKGSWWDWDEAKVALEYLFLTGQLMARGRGTDFARIYDTPQRVLARDILEAPTPTKHDAQKALLLGAAKAQGVATLLDLADYYRLKKSVAAPLVAELVDDGMLCEVQVEGWAEPTYLHKDAAPPKRLYATALLSPFDSMVWFRPRNERLFNFHYRIEIYTPQAKRKYGYYVLPFMINGQMVGRVDLKADRANSALMVHSVHTEKGVKRAAINDELLTELGLLAAWLGLDVVRNTRG